MIIRLLSLLLILHLCVVEAFAGANVAARDISIYSGRDLVVQSRQNISNSSSSGWNASVTFSPTGVPVGGSLSGSSASANRQYTDTPTTIIGENSLDIYTEGRTWLVGSILDVSNSVDETQVVSAFDFDGRYNGNAARGLSLNTGQFVFDNLNDVDQAESISGGVSVGVSGNGSSSFGTTPFAYSYHDRQGITFATVGEGAIRVRDVVDGNVFDFRALNRNANDAQRLIRDESFELNLPAIELSSLSQNLQDSREFFAGLSEERAFIRRVPGISNEEIQSILNGAQGETLRRLVNSPNFKRYIQNKERIENFLRRLGETFNGSLTQDDIDDTRTCLVFGLCNSRSSYVFGLGSGRGFVEDFLEAVTPDFRENVTDPVNENIVLPLSEFIERHQIAQRAIGAVQAAGGLAELGIATVGTPACTLGSGGAGAALCSVGGYLLLVDGIDNVGTGLTIAIFGEDLLLARTYAATAIADGLGASNQTQELVATVSENAAIAGTVTAATVGTVRVGTRLFKDVGKQLFIPDSLVHVSKAHSVNTITPNVRFGGGNRNTPKTIAVGNVDLNADIDEINTGRAILLNNGDILTSSGRVWGRHTGSGETGVFPRSGPGLVNLTQAEFSVFRMMLPSGGLTGNARKSFDGLTNANNAGLNAGSEQRLINLYNSRAN